MLIISGLSFGEQVLAQNARLKAANRQYDNFSYSKAIRQYEDFLRTNRDGPPAERREALTKLGYSYRRMQDSRNAERVYAELTNGFRNVESEAYLYYAQALAQNGKPRESQKMYAMYGDKQAADLRGKRSLVSHPDANRFYRDSASYQVNYLPINSGQADFSPMYYKDGLTFVSARPESGARKRIFNRNSTPFLDLYFSPDTAGLHRTMQPAEAVQEPNSRTKTESFSRTLNTKYHEGPMTFNNPQDFIVFTRTNYSKGKLGRSSEGINKLKLYSADLNAKGIWDGVKELPFNSDEYSTGHPAFAPDDRKLYFVSDKPGGFGGTDLYVVGYNAGRWGAPVNLGKEINTGGNEMFPFVDPTGNLYFASDGHEGMGGLDLFYAEMNEGRVVKSVENLGAPINSDKNDFGFICTADRSSGYFSSNRKKDGDDDNIYYFRKTCKQLNVTVYDAVTRAPMEGIEVRAVIDGGNPESRRTGPSGTLEWCMRSGSNYEFRASQEGYAPSNVRYSTNSSGLQTSLALYLQKTSNQMPPGAVKSEYTPPPTSLDVTLENEKDGVVRHVVPGPDGSYKFDVKPGTSHRIMARKDQRAITENALPNPKKAAPILRSETGLFKQGEIVRIDNIHYPLNKYSIGVDAAARLNRLALVLNQNQDIKIEIRAHTDSRSDDIYNRRLSENRAQAVVDYLVTQGISPGRLVANGYGESELLNECRNGVKCTEARHQENRRTEFKVISVRLTRLGGDN